MSAIVATGPASSGTRMLYYLIEYWVRTEKDPRKVFHWSMPQWQTFWSWQEWPHDTRFVIITRRPDVSTRSALESGHGRHTHERVGFDEWRAGTTLPIDATSLEMMQEWWDRAIDILAGFPCERTYWVSYEAIVANPRNQARGIARFLGFEREDSPVVIRDENRKWLV